MTTLYVIDTLTGDLGKIVAKSQMYALRIWIWMLISPDEFEFKTIKERKFNNLLIQYGMPFGVELVITSKGRKLGSVEFFRSSYES